MTRMIVSMMSAAAALAATSGALAQGGRLHVGSLNGLVHHTFTGNGSFQFSGLCSGPIRAMVANGTELLLGSTDGFVYRFDIATGFVNGQFQLPTPPTAMAMHNGVLIVGAATGPVHRVNPETGAVLGSFNAPIGGVHAMFVQGDTLFVGANNSFVNKGSALTGGFQFLTACGGAVDSMTIANGELVLGTMTNTVYRVNTGTGAYYGTFQLPEAQTAIVADGPNLLISSPTGVIRRVTQTGTVLGSFTAPVTVRTMVIDSCPADVNGSGALTIADFSAFQTAFVLGDQRMDFNLDGALTVADFGAYQNAFVAGCP